MISQPRKLTDRLPCQSGPRKLYVPELASIQTDQSIALRHFGRFLVLPRIIVALMCVNINSDDERKRTLTVPFVWKMTRRTLRALV